MGETALFYAGTAQMFGYMSGVEYSASSGEDEDPPIPYEEHDPELKSKPSGEHARRWNSKRLLQYAPYESNMSCEPLRPFASQVITNGTYATDKFFWSIRSAGVV